MTQRWPPEEQYCPDCWEQAEIWWNYCAMCGYHFAAYGLITDATRAEAVPDDKKEKAATSGQHQKKAAEV